MTVPTLDRLRKPATILAVCAALIVGFDLFILLLNTLGLELSVLNQPSSVRRFGKPVRVSGLGLRGLPLFAVNATLLLAHAALLWLALRVRDVPTRGRAVAAALYALLPCNYSCFLFPISIWMIATAWDPAGTKAGT